MNDTVLTDDEVVALAADRGSFWPAPLPSVDSEDPAELARAAFRGQRSLAVRGLLDGAGNPAPGAGAVQDLVVGASGRLTVYLGDAGFRRAGWGLASDHYPTPSGWLVEGVSPVGVHRFAEVSSEENAAAVHAFGRGAYDSGPAEGEGGARWLCVAVTHGEGATLVAVRRGEYVVGSVSAEGARVEPGTPASRAGLDAAVTDLLRRAQAGAVMAR